ncbi:MAG: hypothetical protein FJ216_05810 [Ignavibacteria bacterium]|nr:hypothetical protein [Ignavibacteria bacterium]
MKQIKSIFFIFALIFAVSSKSIAKKDSIYFFSFDNLFKPVRASVIEAKNGFFKDLNKNYLYANIGISADVIGLKKDDMQYSIGADLFTYSYLRTEDNFKFPVDAIDYMFGVNFNFKKKISQSDLSVRVRISHISAHLEDGHQYPRSDTIFTPFVYSREFADLSGIIENQLTDNLYLKNMLSVNFLFHTIPDDFGKISLEYGFEFNYFFNEIFSVYFSNDLKLFRVNGKTYLNENLETGIRLGKKDSKGIVVFFTYYDGKDYKGQYYNNYLNYKALGLGLIL